MQRPLGGAVGLDRVAEDAQTLWRSCSSKLRASESFSSSKDRRVFSLSLTTIMSLSSLD